MAKAAKPRNLGENTVIADGEELDLHNRYLAAIFAWIIPGAGHFYQRRYFKSAIFSACVFSTFFIGFFISNYRCVYASWDSTEKRWQFVLQAGVGFIAVPAAIQGYTSRDGGDPFFGDRLIAPDSTRELDSWHHDTASGFDMGTLYTMIAGLLNVLVIYDAFAGPLPPPVPKKNEKAGEESEDESASKDESPPS
ncbi:MAG: DUF6677 family protein [Planctomycetota bacterium]